MKTKKAKNVSTKPVQVLVKKTEEITRWENEGGKVQVTVEFPVLKKSEPLKPNQTEAVNQPVPR